MKTKLSGTDFRHLPSAKVAGRVQVVLVTLSVLLFGMFYVVGFDMPYDADPRFTAPLLTDVVLWFSYVLMAVAVVLTLVSVVRGICVHAGDDRLSNGIPAARISWGVTMLLAVSLLVTYIFGSSEPLMINGRRFTSVFWLKLTDMFINTSLLLGGMAIAIVGYGMSGLNRRLHGAKKRKG